MEKNNIKIFTTLFFSLFTAVLGVGIVVPLLPVYAHDLGASGIYIGLIFGSFSLSRTFLLPYFGRISDRKGRKPYIVAGLLGYALVSIAFIFFTSVESLIIIRFFQGVAFAMIMPVTNAYVGDITPKGREGFYMGLFSLSIFGSLSIGPLLGGVISEYFNLQAAFIAMGFFSFISFFMSIVFLPSVKTEHVVKRNIEPVEWGRLIKDPIIAGLCIVRLAYVTCIGIIWCFLPVYADSKFGLSSSSIGILVMLAVFISGVIQVPMGYLADRVNKIYMIIFGGVIVCFAFFSFLLAEGFKDLVIANIIFGLGGGIVMPPLMAISVLKGNETSSMGSVMALLTLSHSLGMLNGSIIAGLAMDFFKLSYSFYFGSIIMFFGVLLFYICTYRQRDAWSG